MGTPPEQIPAFDLYAELEVAPTASAATIDAAWRSLVKRHHPDTTRPDADAPDAAEWRIRRLNIAHDWLADPRRRARYDSDRALRGPGWASGSPPQAQSRPTAHAAEPPPEAEPPRDWASVRREVHRASRPSVARPRSLVASPALPISLGLLSLLVVVVGIVAASRLAGVNQAPVVPDGAPRASGPPVAGETAAPSVAADRVQALVATLPDRVGGIELTGEGAVGAELFDGDTAGLAAFLEHTGGTATDLIGAYKAGEASDGDFLTVIGMQMDTVSGSRLADAFRATTQEGAASQLTWSDAAIAGHSVAVSQDAADPRIAAYMVAAADAMYLVITSDPDLAVAAIRGLP